METFPRVGAGQFCMDWYYDVAWAAILAQLLFLYYAVRNYRYALAKYDRQRRTVYCPRVGLIVPCRGLDAHFHSNIGAFFGQDYDNYRLFFVVDEKSDPAYAELRKARETLAQSSKALDVQILVSGPSTSCSQKIHNLLYVFHRLPDDTEVLAFGDSDVCVHRDWLRHLVWPLRRSKCGVATGYRWFIPTRNNLATLALSAVNGSVAQFLGNSTFNQAWGGSMAVRAEDFRRLNLPEIWKNTSSDDLSLSQAVKKAGMRVTFVPACLVASFESATWSGLCEFGRRQFLITRICAPGTWWLGFLSSLGSVIGLWGTAALAVYAVAINAGNIPLYAAVPVVFLIGQFLRAGLRQSMVMKILSECRSQLGPAATADILGCWLWSLLLFAFVVSSAFGRTIRWRGIRYRLVSPSKTEILGDACASGRTCDPGTRGD